MIKKYHKKPVVVEAIQFTGDNLKECLEFLSPAFITEFDEDYKGDPLPKSRYVTIYPPFEEDFRLNIGDYLVKTDCTVQVCSAGVFEWAYKEVSSARTTGQDICP